MCFCQFLPDFSRISISVSLLGRLGRSASRHIHHCLCYIQFVPAAGVPLFVLSFSKFLFFLMMVYVKVSQFLSCVALYVGIVSYIPDIWLCVPRLYQQHQCFLAHPHQGLWQFHNLLGYLHLQQQFLTIKAGVDLHLLQDCELDLGLELWSPMWEANC